MVNYSLQPTFCVILSYDFARQRSSLLPLCASPVSNLPRLPHHKNQDKASTTMLSTENR
eukprot:m.353734 g.353734  ORF g.353734 m.353734 type:complete len:59 (+) comp16829_c0_seq1:1574-1750(+)